MNTPNLIQADDFRAGGIYYANLSSNNGREYVFARALGFQGLYLFRRLKMAWGVFTGKYDALQWGQGQ